MSVHGLKTHPQNDVTKHTTKLTMKAVINTNIGVKRIVGMDNTAINTFSDLVIHALLYSTLNV
jgi:hypothetical protein